MENCRINGQTPTQLFATMKDFNQKFGIPQFVFQSKAGYNSTLPSGRKTRLDQTKKNSPQYVWISLKLYAPSLNGCQLLCWAK